MNKKILKTLLLGTALSSVICTGISSNAMADIIQATQQEYIIDSSNHKIEDQDVSANARVNNLPTAEIHFSSTDAQTVYINNWGRAEFGKLVNNNNSGLTFDIRTGGQVLIDNYEATTNAKQIEFTGTGQSYINLGKGAEINIGDNSMGALTVYGSDTPVEIPTKSTFFIYEVKTGKGYAGRVDDLNSSLVIKNNATATNYFSIESGGNKESTLTFESNDIGGKEGYVKLLKGNGEIRFGYRDLDTVPETTLSGNLKLITAQHNDIHLTGGISTGVNNIGTINVTGGGKTTIAGEVGTDDKVIKKFNIGDTDAKSYLILAGDMHVGTLQTFRDSTLDISNGGKGSIINAATFNADNTSESAPLTLVFGENSTIKGDATVDNNVVMKLQPGDNLENDLEDHQLFQLKSDWTEFSKSKISISDSGKLLLESPQNSIITYSFVESPDKKTVLVKTDLKIDKIEDVTSALNQKLDSVQQDRKGVQAVIAKLAKATADTTGKAFTLINKLYKKQGEKDIRTILSNIVPTNPLPIVTRVAESLNNSLHNAVQNRVMEKIGVAAGDDMSGKANVWFKGFGGIGKQSASTTVDVDPHESSLWGGMGAVETSNDNGAMGVALSYATTDITYLDSRKDEYKTLAGSLYGYHEFNSGVLVNGSFTVSQSDINSSINTDETIVSTSTSGSFMTGYKGKVDQFAFTPLVGVRFSDTKIPERNSQNEVTAAEINARNVELALGSSMSKEINNGSISMTPELHSFVYYNVNGNTSQRKLVIPGFSNGTGDDSITYSQTRSPMRWNLGGSVTTQSDMVKYSASADANFSDQYWDVQGSLKVQVRL